MPKAQAEMVRESMARRRQRARLAGLCNECCKRKPNPGRTVCARCRGYKSERKRQKRLRDRDELKLKDILDFRERSGDMAGVYHSYVDAARYYQEALQVPKVLPADRERIIWKLANAFFLGGDLEAANVWFESLMTIYESQPNAAAKSVEALSMIRRQFSLDCNAEGMLATARRAVHAAEKSGDARLLKLTRLQWAEALQVVDRWTEAGNVLRQVGQISEEDDAVTRFYYFSEHALAAAAVSDAPKAYRYFDYAFEAYRNDLEMLRIIPTWARCGFAAMEFGDTVRAKGLYEQALFLAQRFRHTRLISSIRLIYAEVLACMGHTEAAQMQLREALSLTSSVPYDEVVLAATGLSLALRLKDDAAIATCAHPKAIEYAFKSQSSTIGNVAQAFAELYVSQGRVESAQILLHRALGTISSAHRNFDVLISIAQHGTLEDIPQARKFLEDRARLPNADTFRAGLFLFDAFVDRRHGQIDQAQRHAREATILFEKIQWHQWGELALSIIPHTNRLAQPTEHKPFSHVRPSLTAREADVAALVLKGLTNRVIAEELCISLHTVEKHVHSILGRLGLRSRHQVASALDPLE